MKSCLFMLVIRLCAFLLQFSRQLSEVFFQLGQKPFVRAKVGYRFINWDQLQIFNQSFSVIHGYANCHLLYLIIKTV